MSENKDQEDGVPRFTSAEKNREAGREKVNQKQQEEKDAAQNPDNNEKTNASYTAQSEQPAGQKLAMPSLFRSGIADKGDYLTLRGKDRPKGAPKPMVTDEQLKKFIMICVVSKGWDKEISIYTDGKIDSQLASRAQMMLGTDNGLQAAIKAQGFSIPTFQMELTEEAPPWAQRGLAKLAHNSKFRDQQLNNNRSSMESLKEAEKLAGRFGNSAEGAKIKTNLKNMRQSIKDERVKLKKTLPKGILSSMIFGSSSAGASAEKPASEKASGSEQQESDKPKGNPTGPGQSSV